MGLWKGQAAPPASGQPWSQEQCALWLQTAAQIFKLEYQYEGYILVTAQPGT